jgi:hypothetical protein
MAGDNGEAGAEGQPGPGAFPKAFAGVIPLHAVRFGKTFPKDRAGEHREP